MYKRHNYVVEKAALVKSGDPRRVVRHFGAEIVVVGTARALASTRVPHKMWREMVEATKSGRFKATEVDGRKAVIFG